MSADDIISIDRSNFTVTGSGDYHLDSTIEYPRVALGTIGGDGQLSGELSTPRIDGAHRYVRACHRHLGGLQCTNIWYAITTTTPRTSSDLCDGPAAVARRPSRTSSRARSPQRGPAQFGFYLWGGCHSRRSASHARRVFSTYPGSNGNALASNAPIALRSRNTAAVWAVRPPSTAGHAALHPRQPVSNISGSTWLSMGDSGRELSATSRCDEDRRQSIRTHPA